MARGILIARCMLAGIGVFALWEGLQHLDIPADVNLSGGARAVSLLLFFGVCGVLFCKLIFGNAGWARRIVGHAQGPEVSEKWIAAGFRLTAMFSGLLILSLETQFIARAMVFVVIAPKLLVSMVVYRYVDDMFLMSTARWLHLAVDMCATALGIFLVIGAPHYARRQVKTARNESGH